MSTTVSKASARTFVGEQLGQDPEWQKITLDYTAAVSQTSRTIRQQSYLGQLLAIYFRTSESYRRWLQWQERGYQKLKPILEARAIAARRPDYKKANDSMQWIIDDAETRGEHLSLRKQSDLQMTMIFVSILTTASACLSVLYDLLSQPEYIKPIRDEVDQVMNESAGHLDAPTLAKMDKLDSFIKEVQRVNGASTVNNLRQVTSSKGITFRNGLHLPQGTVFGVANALINIDPQHWKNPEQFQGFRYANLRASDPENSQRFFMTSTGHSQMTFGHGRHSCPGRFFAALEIKTIFALLLSNYELQPLEQRPRGPMFAGNALANKEVDIFYRSRQREKP